MVVEGPVIGRRPMSALGASSTLRGLAFATLRLWLNWHWGLRCAGGTQPCRSWTAPTSMTKA